MIYTDHYIDYWGHIFCRYGLKDKAGITFIEFLTAPSEYLSGRRGKVARILHRVRCGMSTEHDARVLHCILGELAR